MRKEIIVAKSIKEFSRLVTDFDKKGPKKPKGKVRADVFTATFGKSESSNGRKTEVIENERGEETAIAVMKLDFNKGGRGGERVIFLKKFLVKKIKRGENPFSEDERLRFMVTARKCLESCKLTKGIKTSGPLDRVPPIELPNFDRLMKEKKVEPFPLNKVSGNKA